MKETRRLAFCGIMAALCVVILLLGAILDLGMYAAPLLAGLCLIPVGDGLGRKQHLLLWFVVSVLGFILVPNIEENLMFFALFGPYPILRPLLERLPKLPCILVKFACFNAVVVGIEALVMLVLVPESMGTALTVALLLLGNLTFLCYDFIIPRARIILNRRLEGFMSSFRK